MTRLRWLGVAVWLGVLYGIVGVLFATPHDHVQIWRLAAWALCIGGFGAQIRYEYFRLRSSPLGGALHAAFAVALGGFLLAAAANIHASAAVVAVQRHNLRLALVIWPIITAVPAFVAALVISLALARAFPTRIPKRPSVPNRGQ